MLIRVKEGGFSDTKIKIKMYAESPSIITFDKFFLLIFYLWPEYKNKSLYKKYNIYVNFIKCYLKLIKIIKLIEI